MGVFDNILFPVKDFASSKVATAPSPADTGTSLSVTAGEGTLFPTPSTDGVFRAYVWPDAVEPDATNCEEIEITVKSTDDFTIVRSKNSIVRSILVGDNIAINFGKSKEDQVLNILKDGRIEDILLPSQSFTRDSDTQFKTPGDKTDYYTAGRIVLVNDSGTTTSHIVVSSSYSSPNTTVIISGTVLPASLDNIYIAIQPKDGTSPGVGVISNIKSEVPSGTIDGSNTDFTIANTPVTGTLMVYLNGIRQKITDDYTFTGTTITFITAPLTDSKILVDYDINAGNYATGSASFVDNETPSGLVNSSNTTFTLVSAPMTGSLMLFRDGQLLTGGGADYTLTTNSIAFVTAPVTGSVLLAFYQSAVSTAGNADLLDGKHSNELVPLTTKGDLQTFSTVPARLAVGSDGYKLIANSNETTGLQYIAPDGWEPALQTWTRESDNSFSEPIDATLKYQKGDKLRYKQGGAYKYQYILSVGAYSGGKTIITTYGGSDYVFTNGTAITDNYYSHIENPIGFPPYFNFTGTSFVGSTGSPVSITQALKFKMINGMINVFGTVKVNDKGTATGLFFFTIPFTSLITVNGVVYDDAQTGKTGSCYIPVADPTKIYINPSDFTTYWVNNANVIFNINLPV